MLPTTNRSPRSSVRPSRTPPPGAPTTRNDVRAKQPSDGFARAAGGPAPKAPGLASKAARRLALKRGLSRAASKKPRRVPGAWQHAPWRRRVKGSPAQRRRNLLVARASRARAPDGSEGLRYGSKKRRAIRVVQHHLQAAGYAPGRDDGVFDARTRRAVEQFQRRARVPVSGRVDRRTWRALQRSEIEARGAYRPAQGRGERSRAVLLTERRLKKIGLNPGRVDGFYSGQTQRAVDAFRRREGVRGRGGVGAALGRRLARAAQPGVSAGTLRRIMPGLSVARARALAGPLGRAMKEAGITTTKRRAAFLAQLGHESAGLRHFEELASGADYEGRSDLGNTRPGDGRRYKGRGPIQLTGRANYRAAGRALGLPLEAKPGLASRPDVGFRIATWFWNSRGLSPLADRGDFREITRRINGGLNGYGDRLAYWARAKRALS